MKIDLSEMSDDELLELIRDIVALRAEREVTTKFRIDAIREIIHNQAIYPPGLSVLQLQNWLNGYISCMDRVDNILKKFAEEELIFEDLKGEKCDV